MLFEKSLSRCKPDAPQVVSKENNNRHIVERKSQCSVYQYHLDGDILKNSNGKRCDYIVEVVPISGRSTVFLIELKGSDLDTALEQITETIKKYKEKLNAYEIRPRVVLHKVRTHAVNGSNYRRFRNNYPNTIVKESLLIDRV